MLLRQVTSGGVLKNGLAEAGGAFVTYSNYTNQTAIRGGPERERIIEGREEQIIPPRVPLGPSLFARRLELMKSGRLSRCSQGENQPADFG